MDIKKHHKQMKLTDRIRMETLLNAGYTKGEVAKQLKFHRSTIYREYNKGRYIHRMSDYSEQERYSSDLGNKAHDYAMEKKGKGLKIGSDKELADFIENKIVNDKFSPEAALAEVNKSKNRFKTTISVRTLYRYIDNGVFFRLTNKDLPVKRDRRRRYKKVKTIKRIGMGESIENRPKEFEDRTVFGHWEMDTVRGKQGLTRSCILVLTERKTRNEILIKLQDSTSTSVVKALNTLESKWGDLFSKVFKSITVDNGSEFKDFRGIEQSIFLSEKRTYLFYCHPYSSWERGSNENNNKLIRRHIPKGTNLDNISNTEIKNIENWINNYPRKLFGYNTSAELFSEEIKKIFVAFLLTI
jgi:hypothetical protein